MQADELLTTTRAWQLYRNAPGSVFALEKAEPPSPRKEQLGRFCRSADYLAHLHRVPVHVIPRIGGRVDGW